MPTPADHIKQWEHNRAFIAGIAPAFPDWAVTATFYTAVHAIGSLLKHDKVESITSHIARNETLSRTLRYKKIWDAYRPLYSLSRTIRYYAKPDGWVKWDQIESEVLRRWLYPIEASVKKLMKDESQLPPISMRSG